MTQHNPKGETMSTRRMTRKTAAAVLVRLADVIKDNVDTGNELVTRLNGMLDEALDDDLFGTEGQLDPRGDRRRGR